MKHSEEIAALYREINGKQVVHVMACGPHPLVMDAILICPPDGEQVSLKPYGYEPEEVLKILIKYGYKDWDLERVSRPEFCLAEHIIKRDYLDVFRRLAALPDGADYNFEVIAGKTLGLSQPSCPYG